MRMPSCIKENELLSSHCTLRIGGHAQYFATPSTEDEIIELITWANFHELDFFVMGHGSNLLFEDSGYRGLIIKIAERFSKISVNANTVTAQAGAWMPYVARKSQIFSLTGLEHTIGIPGNIGGIVTMNAGSQRKSVGSNIISVRYVDEHGLINTLNKDDCNFAYRQSVFQQNNWVILEVQFELQPGVKKKIRKEMLTILRERRRKFPRKLLNCGSVFKSHPEDYEMHGPPGRVIEELGLKGFRVGGVYISEQHANFFINSGEASAKEFKSLLAIVKNEVAAKYQMILEEEVLCVGGNRHEP